MGLFLLFIQPVPVYRLPVALNRFRHHFALNVYGLRLGCGLGHHVGYLATLFTGLPTAGPRDHRCTGTAANRAFSLGGTFAEITKNRRSFWYHLNIRLLRHRVGRTGDRHLHGGTRHRHALRHRRLCRLRNHSRFWLRRLLHRNDHFAFHRPRGAGSLARCHHHSGHCQRRQDHCEDDQRLLHPKPSLNEAYSTRIT